jgi:DNA-binding SARP family transcriptional activator
MRALSAEAAISSGMRVHVLGELAVVRHGATVALPPSKKTRALLAFLVVTRTPHSRKRLCDFLWDGPDDPRAALRWSLAKLRPVLDDGDGVRLLADRERVRFEALGARIDLFEAIGHTTPDVASVGTDALRRAAATLSGDFLDGLDMPDCYQFHEWCSAQRERVRALRLSVLDALVARQVDSAPEEALEHARQRLAVDALSDVAHAAVVSLLARLGRNADALAQVDACRRILDRELGGRRSPALEIARIEIGKVRPTGTDALGGSRTRPASEKPPSPAGSTPAPPGHRALHGTRALVARVPEQGALADFVRSVNEGRANEVVLLSGEPGIGKSRLLDELATLARVDGGTVLAGRPFEGEAMRPFGIWVDLLRDIVAGGLDHELRRCLAPLFPELGDAPNDGESKARLFDGVGRLLRELSARTPLILAVDDLHWLDEASSGLLHYVARVSAGSRLGIACATRDGEIEDNPAALRFVRALRREGRLRRLALAPFDQDAIGDLVRRSVSGQVDVARVFRESGGNPLFALEMARSLASGAPEGPRLIENVIDERLSRLDPRARDMVLWAAALGREFDPESLAAIAGETLVNAVAAFGDLEHCGLVTIRGTRYGFTHELVRKVAYRQLSGPRRRIVHLTIARALAATPDGGATWGDVVHHATLADDAMLIATACVAAGERALRMLARRQARDFAARGLAQTSRLGLGGLSLRVDLLKIAALSAAMSPERQMAFEEDAEDAVRVARDNGRPELAAKALFALGFLRSARGDFEGAHEVTLGAADAARFTPAAESLPTLANTGFCLAIIERELPKARAILDEVAESARVLRLSVIDIELGDGYLAHLSGNLVHAKAALSRGLVLSRARADVWRECMALIGLAKVAIEAAAWDAVHAHAAELRAVARKLSGEGSEGVIADSLDALALRGSRHAEGPASVATAIEALGLADSQAMLAYVLTTSAEIEIQDGAFQTAAALAARALAAAEPLGKPSALILARVALSRCAMGRADGAAAGQHLAEARALLEHPYGVSQRARDAVSDLSARSNAQANARVHAPGAR